MEKPCFIMLALINLLTLSFAACGTKPHVPTQAEIAADRQLLQELQQVLDCIDEIMQPTDEELLVDATGQLMEALYCADIATATRFATDTALGLLLYVDEPEINHFKIKRTDVFTNRGVAEVTINHHATLKLIFSRNSARNEWRLTAVN
ncbi:hypothetical protein C7N43_17355 [Sphingobacteriales bacterium UPWRP_1]|nr:hypothetical protein BVG80_04085 [Sphingobacteriales bacterium TSM_CSM]PSJ75733.1 hypothetical protein C7N43_17355 [Sphingobacteriales bacterium UPWRP_1]